MAFHERPNLKRQMEQARARENALKNRGRPLSQREKEALRKATEDRRAAESIYYSASGQGHAPWEIQMQRWALALFAIFMVGVLVVSLS